MTAEQLRIVEFVRQNRRANLAELEPVFGRHYWGNARKHLSARLSRLVRAGALTRTARGEFEVTRLPFLRRSVVPEGCGPFALPGCGHGCEQREFPGL